MSWFMAYNFLFNSKITWLYFTCRGCVVGVGSLLSIGNHTLGGNLGKSYIIIYQVKWTVATLFIAWQRVATTFC